MDGSGVADGAVLGRLDRHVRWNVIAQGIGLIVAGTIVTTIMIKGSVLGGYSTPLYLVPSAVALLGLWRMAMGVFST